jgi:hypothetical protein
MSNHARNAEFCFRYNNPNNPGIFGAAVATA